MVGLPILLFAAATDPAGVAAARLCEAGERQLFGCAIGVRHVALCAGGSGASAYVQYRSRRRGKLDLVYPDARRGSGGMSYATTGYSGGGAMQVRFRTAGAAYAVYSQIVRTNFGPGGNNPQASAGVIVRMPSGRSRDFVCTSPRNADFAADVFRLLPQSEFED